MMRRRGKPFEVHLRLEVPGGEIVVSHWPTAHTTVAKGELAVSEAFDEARRQLLEHVRRSRHEVKRHEPSR